MDRIIFLPLLLLMLLLLLFLLLLLLLLLLLFTLPCNYYNSTINYSEGAGVVELENLHCNTKATLSNTMKLIVRWEQTEI